MIRQLNDIIPQKTSHGVGEKRVLLAANESGCSLTQIAVTTLRAGEVAIAHIHPDMQEGFYVLEGQLEITLGPDACTEPSRSETLKPSETAQGASEPRHEVVSPDTFVYVDKCTSHEMRALTDCRILTIGCVIEASRNKYYPFLFKLNRKTLVWGTEDWTVSAVPGSESEIENGTWARYRLDEVIRKHSTEILGRETARKYHNQLPLLTKIIDAHSDLSIQVHPNDEMALREHNKMGKSEMWYILDAEPGAYLYAGFKEQITPEEFKELIATASSSLALSERSERFGERVPEGRERGFTDVLAKHEVHPGDVFYLPSGRVHAICGGIRLAEVQQSSDVTYRIFDYNRPGLDGRPRELHTELAARAIDYTVYPEYKTEHSANPNKANVVLNTPFFSINVVDTYKPILRNMLAYDSFVILMNLGNECRIRIRSTHDEITLPPNTSCLIPACIADYEILPLSPVSGPQDLSNYAPARARVLESFINNRKSIGQLISDFFRL